MLGLQKLLEYVRQYEVRKVVLLSSANVYGPRPDNPQFLTEEAPLLAASKFSAMRDLGSAFTADATHIFMVKASYWLNR